METHPSKPPMATRQTVIHRSPSARSPGGDNPLARSPSDNTILSSPRSPPPPERTTSRLRASYYSGDYSDKPLPEPTPQHHDYLQQQRPGTAATEAALKINIRRASEQLRQAQQAERMYRAMKRAAAVHTNRTESKAHFRQSVEHLQLGVRKGFLGVVGFPHIIREKYELKRQRGLEAAGERRERKEGKLALEGARREVQGRGKDERFLE